MSGGAIYLVNYDAGRSAMCYYNDVQKSLNGQTPDIIWAIPEGPGFEVIWEGQPVVGNPWTGSLIASDVFITNVNQDAFSQPQGTPVGTGEQGPVFAVPPPGTIPQGPVTYVVWTIFRDATDRVLFTDPTLGRAISLYECRPVSTACLVRKRTVLQKFFTNTISPLHQTSQLIGGPIPPPLTGTASKEAVRTVHHEMDSKAGEAIRT